MPRMRAPRLYIFSIYLNAFHSNACARVCVYDYCQFVTSSLLCEFTRVHHNILLSNLSWWFHENRVKWFTNAIICSTNFVCKPLVSVVLSVTIYCLYVCVCVCPRKDNIIHCFILFFRSIYQYIVFYVYTNLNIYENIFILLTFNTGQMRVILAQQAWGLD